MPRALVWTGLRISTPASMRSGQDVDDRPAAVQEDVEAAPADALEDELLAGLEDLAVEPGRDHGRLLRAEVVAHLDDLDVSFDGVEELVEIGEMHLDQGVEEALGLGPVLGQVDEELVEAAEVFAPLEEVGAEAGHDGVVGRLIEPAGLVPDVGQVLRREGLVEGRRGQGRPGDLGHELGQAAEKDRIAVPVEKRELASG